MLKNVQNIKIPIPVSGMNQLIAETELPSSHAQYISNFIIHKHGTLHSRNGVKPIEWANEDEELCDFFSNPLTGEAFVCSKVYDRIDFEVKSSTRKITVHSSMKDFISKGTKIRVNKNEIFCVDFFEIKDEEVDLYLDRELIVSKDDSSSLSSASAYDSRPLITKTVRLLELEKILLRKRGVLENKCLFNSAFPLNSYFIKNTFLFSNGIDRIKEFKNGQFVDFCQELKISLTAESSGKISIDAPKDIEDIFYNNDVACKIDGTVYIPKIINDVVSLMEKDNPTSFLKSVKTDNAVIMVYPPRSSSISYVNETVFFIAGNTPTVKEHNKQRIYFSYSPSSVRGLIGKKGLIPSASFSSAIQGNDHNNIFLGIYIFQGNVLIFGTSQILVLQGFRPDFYEDPFRVSSVLPVDVVSSRSILPIGNDILFLSFAGLKRLSSLNVASQTAITDVSEIDPLLSEAMTETEAPNCSLSYLPRGNLVFVHVGSVVAVFQNINEQYIAMSLYEGDFFSCATSVRSGLYDDIIVVTTLQAGSYNEERIDKTEQFSSSVITPTFNLESNKKVLSLSILARSSGETSVKINAKARGVNSLWSNKRGECFLFKNPIRGGKIYSDKIYEEKRDTPLFFRFKKIANQLKLQIIFEPKNEASIELHEMSIQHVKGH